MAGGSHLVDVAERRLDFLERLVEEPLRKHELVDALGHSRSTVNRAIDELESAGLVAGETDGYRTTLTGRLLARSYRRFLTVADDVHDASEALAPLGSDVRLEPAALRGAETYRAAAPQPYRPLERLDEVLLDTSDVGIALPTLPYPQLLDRCRRAAAAGGSVELVVTDRTYQYARERYDDTLAGLARRDGVTVSVIDDLDVGVLVADGTATLLVFDDDGSLHATAESTAPEAIAWARDRVRSLLDAGHDVTAELATIQEARANGHAGEGTEPLTDPLDDATGRSDIGSNALSAQGFVALDDDRLDGHADPTGPLRAPPSFAEVDAGYVLDRTAADDGERYGIADRLIDGLADGTDRALIGPPGSGKSTVCRIAAVRWHRSGRGPVLYRASDEGEPFTATERLRDRVRGADGHVLVVVEDCVTPDAADVMGVARGLSDRSDVSFLFDAREEAYDDPDSLPLRPADLEYRRRIGTVRMPRLDHREVERFVDHVAELTDTDPTVDAAALLDRVRSSGDDRPGELPCLLHHLIRATDHPAATVRGNGGSSTTDGPSTDGPTADGSITSDSDRDGATAADGATGSGSGIDLRATSLEAAVDDAVRDLIDRPPPTVDVAVLVNLLNVAGVSDVRTFAYALAGRSTLAGDAGTGATAAGSSDEPNEHPTFDAVRRALVRLEGTVLVPSAGDPDRTVHEEWSVLFLERLLEREPTPVVARRVGLAATRVLALADDPARRSRIRRMLGDEAAAMDRIERDPESWAAEMTRSLYGVGRRYPRLAELYGRVRYSWIDLPDACPDDLADRPPEWVARMYIDAGDLDGATAALDAWRPADEAAEAERQRGFGDVSRRRGEYDAARERYDRAAELFASAGDHGGLADAVRGQAQAAHFAGDYETAYESASQAYALARRNEDPIQTAKSLMDVANALDALRGTDAVIEHYRVACGLFRTYDDTHGEANVRMNIAVAWRRRGDLAAATREARLALDGYRTVGDEHREAIARLNLATIAEQRGEVAEAAAHARDAWVIADRIGSDLYRAFAVSHLGSAAQLAGDPEAAERQYLRALDAFEELGADSRCAMVTTMLAEVAVERDDLSAAERWIDRTASLIDDHAGRRRIAELERIRGAVACRRGELDRAETALTTALDEARAGGFTMVEALALADFGAVAAKRGDAATAADRFAEALDLGIRIEGVRAVVDAAEGMASLLADHDDPSELDVRAVGPIAEGAAGDPAEYRDLADRWRVDDESVALDFTPSE